MTRHNFLERLSKLSPEDSAGLTALAQDVVREAREAVDTAVQAWQQGDEATSRKAMLVLAEVEDLALVPLIDAGPARTVEQVMWSERTVGAGLAELQRRALRWIDNLLMDKRRAPVRKSVPPLEEQPPPVRVCDEAYLQMRRLLNVEEGKEKYFTNARAFLFLSDAQKDAEIQKARHSRAWTQFTGD